MATYMLLLYAEDADEQTRAERWVELPEWHKLTEELRERAVWIANAALHPVESATTVRVRDGEALDLAAYVRIAAVHPAPADASSGREEA